MSTKKIQRYICDMCGKIFDDETMLDDQKHGFLTVKQEDQCDRHFCGCVCLSVWAKTGETTQEIKRPK